MHLQEDYLKVIKSNWEQILLCFQTPLQQLDWRQHMVIAQQNEE